MRLFWVFMLKYFTDRRKSTKHLNGKLGTSLFWVFMLKYFTDRSKKSKHLNGKWRSSQS